MNGVLVAQHGYLKTTYNNACGKVDTKINDVLLLLICRRETFSTSYWSAASLLIHVFLHAAWMKQIVQSGISNALCISLLHMEDAI